MNLYTVITVFVEFYQEMRDTLYRRKFLHSGYGDLYHIGKILSLKNYYNTEIAGLGENFWLYGNTRTDKTVASISCTIIITAMHITQIDSLIHNIMLNIAYLLV